MRELRVNPREKLVQEYYASRGYETIRRGWPDFCFVKGDEVLFIEVKRKGQRVIKREQEIIRDLFTKLGLTYKVAFELKPDGTPNFKEYSDRHSPKLAREVKRRFFKERRLASRTTPPTWVRPLPANSPATS